MLVVFGGLPGTGKTTTARAIATRRAAVYLRVDVIEQALRSSGVLAAGVGPAGYEIGNALAHSNLSNGLTVVADCVNPVPESRKGWRQVASLAGARLIEVELVCSDPVEHRRRVEQRRTDVAGLLLPSWADVLARDYAPWPEPHLVLDTARLSESEAVEAIEHVIAVG